jgi:hypothetical protein
VVVVVFDEVVVTVRFRPRVDDVVDEVVVVDCDMPETAK